eukprot:CAMPEP_0173429298 /NCGR_PEP_ID=MMETSP1357-20121228/8041_1 /TAXON_ID=77926 /ORGANISM="Hemiselmis rufescens, Strain PCC563" /LENGTH=895 /DNA_ID=CAMNT_0014393455 /DNA_START=110 /DNA_END=2794 /DNA_ORIENTATION=-
MAHGLKFEEQLEGGGEIVVESENERLRKQHVMLLEQEKDKSWKRSYKKPWFWCVIAFVVWLFAGIAWYALWHEWGFFLAFYYHLQAGLSIGFGFPTEDDICYKENIANPTVRYYTEGNMRWPSPAEGGRGGCQASDISKAVTVIFVLSGSSIIASAIGIIAQTLTAPAGGWYKTLIAEEKIKHLQQLAAESPGIADDVVIFLKILGLKSWFQALVSIAFWVAAGILYGMLSEQKMTFITSFYYAVSSVSTAGMESPKTIQGNPSVPVSIGELNPGHWAFSGIYVLIGVPLYGWALSALAAGYVAWVTVEDADNTLHEQITEDEFQIMDYLGYPSAKGAGGDGEIDMFEFVECQLLRLNLVSVSHLMKIKMRFIDLDIDDSGTIDKDELILPGGVEQPAHPGMSYAMDALKSIHHEIEDMRDARSRLTTEEKTRLNDESQALAKEKTAEAALNKTWGRFYKQAWFKCLTVFALWIMTACIFYTQWQQWGFWQSLYYSIQAGMSVGFPLPTEDEMCSKTDIVGRAATFIYPEGQQYTPFLEGGRGGCVAGDFSKLFTTLLILVGSSIIASSIGIIAVAVLNPPGGWYKQVIKEAKLEHLRQSAKDSPGITDDVVIYIRILFNQNLFKACLAFTVWVFTGVLFGCFSEQRMTFLTGLYFSVTSIATAGLEGLAPLGPDTGGPEGVALPSIDDINEGHWFFMTQFLMLGIPIYGWALSSLAGVCMASLNEKFINDALMEQITNEEFSLIDYLGDFNEKGAAGDGKVDMFEYVECQLLRLNFVSVSQLFAIKRRFLELDLDSSGTINREELVATGSDVDGKGSNPSIKHALEAMEKFMEEIELKKGAHDHTQGAPTPFQGYPGGPMGPHGPMATPMNPYKSRQMQRSVQRPPGLPGIPPP